MNVRIKTPKKEKILRNSIMNLVSILLSAFLFLKQNIIEKTDATKTIIKETLGIKIPYWTESLKKCVNNLKSIEK